MNIHEYQAKDILKKYCVPVPKGMLVESLVNAERVPSELGGSMWAVKAQIHAGGRGKGGGVKLAKSKKELFAAVKHILGMQLITHQTGPQGKKVRKILVEKSIDIQKEFYLGIVLDRTSEMPVMIASTEGGVEIEKVAAESPEKIVKAGIDPLIGFQNYHSRKLAFALKLSAGQIKEFSKFTKALYKVYRETDASLIEINPLVLTKDDKFIALDAKMGFDDNALSRHPDIIGLRDLDEEEPTEIEAGIYGLSYVKLDGDVGCMVNGAGLAMSTMDIIKHEGGEPANFLDVGGASTAETVAKGFEIILHDKNVKAIFVNIFGGIVRCDRIANGILEATGTNNVEVPVIVRLDGTNVKEAIEILKSAKIKNIIPADNLSDGAKKAVAAANGVVK
ncbi:MAG: ADP-forming succinate--CoA ligase subunit beta [Candidatus Cloacimonetes bacterium]|nr:ADP-forming succinate--CoA ligase subunit beta [Candidatus Cloacimonadota bacterium]